MRILPQQKVMDEILRVTSKIRLEFPEYYRYLNETPLFMFEHAKGISGIDFEQYLASLVAQMAALRKLGKRP